MLLLFTFPVVQATPPEPDAAICSDPSGDTTEDGVERGFAEVLPETNDLRLTIITDDDVPDVEWTLNVDASYGGRLTSWTQPVAASDDVSISTVLELPNDALVALTEGLENRWLVDIAVRGEAHRDGALLDEVHLGFAFVHHDGMRWVASLDAGDGLLETPSEQESFVTEVLQTRGHIVRFTAPIPSERVVAHTILDPRDGPVPTAANTTPLPNQHPGVD